MNKIAVFVLLSIVFFQYSCKKSNPEPDKDIQSIVDNTLADNVLQDVFITLNNYANNYLTNNSSKIDTVPIVTISPQYPLDSFPKTMQIDYRDGINCSDGKLRKGKIIATVYSFWNLSENDSMSVELVDFTIDSINVNSNIVIKFIGDTTNMKYDFKTSNCIFSFNNGENFQIHSNKTINYISGFKTTNDLSDDIFLIDGESNGINRKQIGFEANIISSIKYVSQCYGGTITQGKLEIIPQDATKRVVDFGEGNCDKIVNITINGISFEIEL
ncbi:MAG: hypothetical protein COS14_07395 [Bacteroidetes bacterium CG02_land_8_20_14_3_00_31_25]|nr:hypothetical protein [Bacteroidota bacterium]PIV58858.1 MAG: hypothetical protein COS14_07395 [Bacteroidetes bacterium CG02_land_8_20_14_3_00_31_25]PIX32341.1 MAG: hypothetical protein COZ59_14545 [Bacteroidetes bacterium CG_4_8_14_3_um_filter_31_14]PIY03220.1 MAG: hypothetical protein COZ21_10115 [Bacteroidetes bacterium CG_4_10_14_3_um_filter_31_20]